MGSIANKVAATIVTGVALAAAPSAAYARPAAPGTRAAGVHFIRVPCSAPALVAAINTANGLGTATLRLAARCIYNYAVPAPTLTDALPLVTGNITLLGGPSTTIRRDPAAATDFRLFHVLAAGTLQVRGIFLLNGNPAADGGGAIINDGRLVLSFTTVSGNSAQTGNGGALLNTVGSTALITHSVFSNNATLAGNGGAIDNSGRLSIVESRFSGNNAAGDGGAVNNEAGATVSFVQSTIDHNFATGNGGGLANTGTASLLRSLVVANRATLNGGGIFNTAPGTVSARFSIIRANTPNNCFPLNTVPGCTG